MYENFPYSNFHDLNTDWLINRVKNVETSEANAAASEQAAAGSATAAAQSATASDQSAQASAQSAQESAQSAEESANSASEADNYVSSTRAQVTLLQSRVDNIIPSGTQTEGNTELIDIRVAEDGQIYGSAGNAVRGQVRNLKNALNYENVTVVEKNGFYIDNGGFIDVEATSNTVLIDLTQIDANREIFINILGNSNRCRLLFTTTLLEDVTARTSGTYVTKGDTTKSFTIDYQSWKNYKTLAVCSNYHLTPYATVNAESYADLDSYDNGITDISVLKTEAENIISGMNIDIQWIRGYWAETGGRPRATADQLNRFITTYKPMYLYKGSYFYCDTLNLYYYTLIKYSDSDGNNVTNYIGHQNIPLADNKIIINEDGYYTIRLQRYDAQTINISDVLNHVTFNLHSNKENPIYSIFLGGGKENFQAPGDSNIVIGKTGKVILIDSGLDNTEGQLWNCMNSNGIIEPDYIILSHMHNDHIGGLVRLLENNLFNLNNKTMFMPSQNGINYAIDHDFMGETSIDLYNRLMQFVNNATNLTVIRPSTEFETYYIDGMIIKFWNVDHQVYIDMNDTNYNDYSLCCNIECYNQRVCYTGDLGPIGMGVNAGKNYKCNIYKAQHHGWDNITAQTDILNLKKWMSTVFPQIVISEDGISHDTLLQGDNAPMPDWCKNNGIPFYRTNQNGFIYVRIDGDSWNIITPVIRWTKSEYQSS